MRLGPTGMDKRSERSVSEPGGPPSGFGGSTVHMIGVGGCGMSGAARILARLGAKVSGSDLTPFDGLGALVADSIRVSIGHDADHVHDDVDLVVTSAAIPESNVELAKARHQGLRVLKYAELLAALMERRSGVAIAGTHGKSTTTAMCAHLFRTAGLSPSFLVGAISDQLGGNSAAGAGDHFIAEACEYDRSFLHLRPEYAAILNIEPDHLDCYRDIGEIVQAFTEFAANVDPEGLVLCNAEDELAMQAAAGATAKVETFGIECEADWRGVNLRSENGQYAFDVTYRGAHVLSARLTIAGKHNVYNALPAVALARRGGADAESLSSALSTFAGTHRRMTWRGQGRGVQIVDDYAHHPTEIRVTIEAVRNRYRPKRVWVVFQPHQHARTRHLFEDFAESFMGVDEVIVPDIYGAREGGSFERRAGAEELASRIREKGGSARYLPSLGETAEHVAVNATDGDLVVTMGAGDVWKVADELVERFCSRHGV